MDAALGLAGWGATAAVAGLAGLLHARLARATDAVARATHELRGPLTAVRLGLELGFRGLTLPPGRLRAVELELGRAALALDDLTAVHAPPRAVRREPVDLAELAAASVEAWRAAARTHQATLRLDRPGQPLWVIGDRLRLAQAVGNLIANGIEHAGGVVEVRLRRARGYARVEVVDAGPGLPAPINELSRRRRSWTLRASERGHGLPITLAVAAAHGGWLTTAPAARGSRVVLALPAAERPTAHEVERL